MCCGIIYYYSSHRHRIICITYGIVMQRKFYSNRYLTEKRTVPYTYSEHVYYTRKEVKYMRIIVIAEDICIMC